MKQVTQVSQIFILEAIKLPVFYWIEVIDINIANCFSKAEFLQDTSSEDDNHFSELRALNQL